VAHFLSATSLGRSDETDIIQLRQGCRSEAGAVAMDEFLAVSFWPLLKARVCASRNLALARMGIEASVRSRLGQAEVGQPVCDLSRFRAIDFGEIKN